MPTPSLTVFGVGAKVRKRGGGWLMTVVDVEPDSPGMVCAWRDHRGVTYEQWFPRERINPATW